MAEAVARAVVAEVVVEAAGSRSSPSKEFFASGRIPRGAFRGLAVRGCRG